MAQIKFLVNDELAKRFKQTVLAKRGKMESSREGEEALKLYLEKNEDFVPSEITKRSRKTDPIIQIIGAVKTGKRRSALEDVKMLESSEI